MVDGIKKASPYLRRILIVGVICILVVMVMVALARPQITRNITNFDECIEAGGARMESYPERCMIDGKTFTDSPDSSTEASEYVGLTENDATRKAKEANKPHRVVERDGESLPVTMDFVPGRLNFVIEDGKVKRVEVEGENR